MSQEEDIAELLIQAVKTHSPTTGGHLGPLVKEHYPAADLKSRYGGLHRFIKTYCGTEIVFLGKRGVDNVYAYKDSRGTVSSHGSGTADAWRAFSNPKIHLTTLVDTRSGDIDVASPSQAELKDGWLPIEKISAEEYRLMAQDFLATLEPSEAKNQLQHALTIPNFWPTWSLLINRLRAQGIYNEWLNFRTRQIRNLFRVRLSQLNLSEEVCDQALRSLRASREQIAGQRSAEQVVGHKFAQAADRNEHGQSTRPEFRNVILQAVSRLTDEDLRRIWLPAGVLIDALKGNHS